jgi:hypothetical protein
LQPPGEQMPGPASIWLISEPAAPASPVDVAMTSPDEPGIRFAHTFAAGDPLRGSFFTSQGRYTLAALSGMCSLPIVLGPGEAADVLLTLDGASGCRLSVVQRGQMDDPAMHNPGDGVSITNLDAGAATPSLEPVPPPDGP